MINLIRVTVPVVLHECALTRVTIVQPQPWKVDTWQECPWLVLDGDDGAGVDVTRIAIGNVLQFMGGPIPLRTLVTLPDPVFDVCDRGCGMEWVFNNPTDRARHFTMMLTAYTVRP